MIHIFFVPGMFGSMIEMFLRSFTDIDGTLTPEIKNDGSCHTFTKNFHVNNLARMLREIDPNSKITTICYPWQQQTLDEIQLACQTQFTNWSTDRKILIHAPDQKWAEINMLFQYHKISAGLGMSLDIFGGENNIQNIKRWNSEYSSWKQMQRWEYREWLSLFYPQWIQEWISSPRLVSDDFLILTNQDILESTRESLQTVFDFCNVTMIKSFQNLCDEYRAKQQYILDEYHLIECVLESTITQQDFTWTPLSIVGEAILQGKFRQQGYAWRCDGMNILPTNTQDFIKIIYFEEIH